MIINKVSRDNKPEQYDDLIAQGKTGSGKTGAFTVGSLIRLDQKNPKTQIVVMGNTRELVNQIYAVYQILIKGSDITLANGCIDKGYEKNQKQILVTTIGQIENKLKGRSPMDMSSLKCLIVDEADDFFKDEKNVKAMVAIRTAITKQNENRDSSNRI